MEEEGIKKVLIVDDEEDMIWSLQKNLPNSGLEINIVTASSGEGALAILQKTKIDLIITDIKMPGISGIDLLIAVKKTYPNIGVIVMTSFPSSYSKSDVMERGGLCFIEKPFDIQEMRNTVKKAIVPDSSFEGTITGLQLGDIIQLNNLSQASSALRVKTSAGKGILYFSEGNIIHASCGDLVGEDAFYELIRFEGGTIESFYPEQIPEPTITAPVSLLLLQGAVMADERKHKEMENEESVVLTSETDSTYPATIEPIEEEDNMNELQNLLTEFTNIPGVNTVCLVGRDGFLLESVALSGIDAEMIGAIASSGFGASEAMGNQLEKGGMSMTMVEYEKGPVIFSPVGEEAFMVIIAERDANLGMIRLKIKKHAKNIEKKSGI